MGRPHLLKLLLKPLKALLFVLPRGRIDCPIGLQCLNLAEHTPQLVLLGHGKSKHLHQRDERRRICESLPFFLQNLSKRGKPRRHFLQCCPAEIGDALLLDILNSMIRIVRNHCKKMENTYAASG